MTNRRMGEFQNAAFLNAYTIFPTIMDIAKSQHPSIVGKLALNGFIFSFSNINSHAEPKKIITTCHNTGNLA